MTTPSPRKPTSARASSLAAVLALATSCGPHSADQESVLREIERFAFVPAGRAAFQDKSGQWTVCETLRPLFVDRFEASRGEWRAFQRARLAHPDPVLAEKTAAWTDDTSSWAASWMTLDEAREYAKQRGMRLPTAREWVRIACGTRGLPYPWGGSRISLVANTSDLGLGRPIPVGTFELGATPVSIYDLCGNVCEWVDAPVLSDAQLSSPGQSAWAMGGSFASALRPLTELDDKGLVAFEHLDLDPLTRGEDLGLRCVMEADEWLGAHAQQFALDADTRARLVAVGARFGRDAVPLLLEVQGRGHATQPIAWLLEGAQH
jgi:formylglycine-generating enzyme required for sulfatase activity